MYRVPVSVGEELDVTIEAVGEKGDGIAKKDGFILFVPGVKQGDRVRIKVNKVLKKVGFADVIKGGAQSAPEEASEEAPEEISEEESVPESVEEDSEDFGDESADNGVTDDIDEDMETVEEPAE